MELCVLKKCLVRQRFNRFHDDCSAPASTQMMSMVMTKCHLNDLRHVSFGVEKITNKMQRKHKNETMTKLWSGVRFTFTQKNRQ